MAVTIDQINIETAGPISGLQLSLGPFNLIYGHNERGKTFLVEFVIRSLFKNLSGWNLRKADNRGKIIVSGLTDNPLSLMPSSNRKLEDYLAEAEPGLPAQISRLLVVKGAELSFADAPGSGINRDVLQEFLSGQGVLDDIQGHISKTVQGAQIEAGQITGYNRGELKNRSNSSSDLADYDHLFQQLDAVYSGAERQALQDRVKELEEALAEQALAKRHQAYQIHQKIQQQQKYLDRLPQAELKGLEDDFAKLQDIQKRIGRQAEKLAEWARQSEHYEWLEEAITLYTAQTSQGKVTPSLIYPVVIVIALLLALVFSFIGFPLGTFVMIAIGLVAGWLYIRQYRLMVDRAADVVEIKKLETEFQSRFDRPLSGLPQMNELKKSMAEAYHGSKTLAKELEDEKGTLASLHDQIAARFQSLMGRTPEPDQWAAEIQKMLQVRDRLQGQINRYQLDLATLDLPEAEYHAQPAAVAYDKKRMAAIQDELAQLEEELREKTADLDNLKQRIASTIGEDISLDWERLIQNLQRKRAETAADYRAATAEILAGILVNQQLDLIRAQEEEKIREKLTSPAVSRPIFDITGRYSGVQYENGRVWLNDDYGQFPLADLSTGAREQALLGLRLGFASHILGKDRLFLLLDDAFQHADWTRRERLLNQMVRLAQDGWQIVYFTMDEHIRGLFDEAGQDHFPGRYHYHELAA